MSTSSKTTRQLQAEQTKLQIFDAAMRLLEEKDFDAITVRDIVREADVSIGSFYHAYPSKLDVFYETYQIADRYFETSVRSRLTQETAQERILFFFQEYALYNSDISLFALTKVLYNPDNTCFHRPSTYGILPILTSLVQQAIDRGEFHTSQSPQEAAAFFMVCIRGVVYDWCTSDGAYDLKARIDLYARRLLRAYA